MTDLQAEARGTLMVRGERLTGGYSAGHREKLTIRDVLEFCEEALRRGATLDSRLDLNDAPSQSITVEIPVEFALPVPVPDSTPLPDATDAAPDEGIATVHRIMSEFSPSSSSYPASPANVAADARSKRRSRRRSSAPSPGPGL